MNVLLINPKLKTWSPNIYVPLGLTYVAAALEKAEHTVRIIDSNSRSISDQTLVEQLKTTDVVGLTGMIPEFQEVVRLTRLIKTHYRVPVVLGGPLATTWTERVLLASGADLAVIGEGEATVVELLSDPKCVINWNTVGQVRGVAYRITNEVMVNSPRSPIVNPDTIQFPSRKLLDMNRYTNLWFRNYGRGVSRIKGTTMFTSRGCPYHCTFCFMDMWGHKWRGRSPSNILEEMAQLHEDYGYHGFVFYDDTFVLNKPRVLELCQRFEESKLNPVWHCNGRIDLMTKELVQAMSQAGCKGIAYGIESGNQDIINLINKGVTLDQVRRVTRYTEEAGIKVTGLFMIGMLGETKQTIQQTLDFARELNLSSYCFALTVPLQGTPLYTMAKTAGCSLPNSMEDWSFHANANLTTDCTKAELEKFSRDAFREFNLEKVYGKNFRTNPKLWLDGLGALLFLIGKRSNKDLIKRALGIITGR